MSADKDHSDKQMHITDFLDKGTIQALMDQFYEVTSLPMSIVDLEGNVLVGIGWQDICTNFHRTNPESLARCLESDLELAKHIPRGEYRLYKCKNNMWDAATPLIIEDKHMGNIFMGQFFFDDETPDEDLFRRQAREYGYDEEAYIEAFRRIPVFSRKHIQNAMVFFTAFAELIASMSYNRSILSAALAERDRLIGSLQSTQATLRNYIDNAPVAVIVIDGQGNYIDVNPMASTMAGYSREEFLSMKFLDVIPPESRPAIMESFRHLITSGSLYDEGPFVGKNGKSGYWSLNAVKVSPDRFLAFVQDITESRQTAERLEKSREDYRLLFENQPTGFALHEILLDENGDPFDYRFIDVNPAFERLTGFSREQVIGRTVLEVMPQTEPVWIETYGRVARTGEPERLESYAAGIGKYFSVTVYRPQPGQFVTSFLDITKRKTMELALQKSEEQMDLFLNATTELVFLKDSSLKHVFVNDAYVSFLERTREETLGKTDFEILPDQLAEQCRKSDETVLSSGEPVTLDESLGENVFESRKFPVRLSGGSIGVGAFIRDVTTLWKARKDLRDIEWMLSEKGSKPEAPPEEDGQGYGDLTELNENGEILRYVGKDLLKEISSDYLNLLDTSSAIYERNGDYAFGIFSSGWCRMLDRASRDLCPTDDNAQALASGKWLCHESCWTRNSMKAVESGEPVDIICSGGIHMFSVPIFAYGEIIGAMNFGYGDPPEDSHRQEAIARAYNLPAEKVRREAEAYDSRPPFIIELAKKRLFASARLIGTLVERGRAKDQERQATEKLRRAVRSTIEVLAQTVERRDPYTAGHQRRVADLAAAVAVEMGLPTETVDAVSMAGYVHDIGKISVPSEILSKPGKLSEVEMDIIKSHPEHGREILGEIESPWPLAEIVEQHHERLDGSGYPRGLKGEEIMLEARIMAVADVVEAMASHRPYRPTLGIEKALEEIEQNSGVLYYPPAVEACLRLFREKDYSLKE